jgi:hypothetical protein
MKTLPRMVLYSSILGVAWVGSIAFGMRVLARYESTPGKVGSVPVKFPQDAALTLAADRPTLIMLAHPRCPCTRASLAELAQVMAELQGKVQAYVVFSRPGESGADWNETGLWNSAAAIPGVVPVGDDDGVETRRFGAETSGHTVVFGSNGRLLFSGGITQARGHEGANAGESAIVSLVKNGSGQRRSTPVFGCPLVGAIAVEPKALCLN